MTVEHSDGSATTRFPILSTPAAFMNMRAITHEFAPGVSAYAGWKATSSRWRTSATGSDASYKTYVRPAGEALALYAGRGASGSRQKVTLKLRRRSFRAVAAEANRKSVQLRIGKRIRRRAAVGLNFFFFFLLSASLALEDPHRSKIRPSNRQVSPLAKIKPSHVHLSL